MPTPLLNNKSPFKLLFHKPPSFNHLRVCGCLCFVSTPFVHRLKFESRATPCVFLGYPFNIKGYKVLNLHSRKISISRDVVFHESVFPFSQSSSSSLPPALSIPLFIPSTPGLDSSYSLISIPIPLTDTTPLATHTTSSADSSSPNPSILIGSLPVPLSPDVHHDHSVAHLFSLLIPFHLPVLLLFNILPFLLLHLLFKNPQGLVINLPICKLINATSCLIPLVLLSLCLPICPLINCLLDIPTFVICFPPLWSPSSITK